MSYYEKIKDLAYKRLHALDDEMAVTPTQQKWETEDNVLDAVEEIADLINYLDFTRQRRERLNDGLLSSEDMHALDQCRFTIQLLAQTLEHLDRIGSPVLRRGVRKRQHSREEIGLQV
jgi:hypothetical protein